jgi:hypothetical protein
MGGCRTWIYDCAFVLNDLLLYPIGHVIMSSPLFPRTGGIKRPLLPALHFGSGPCQASGELQCFVVTMAEQK